MAARSSTATSQMPNTAWCPWVWEAWDDEETEVADPVVLAAAEFVPCMACGCSPDESGERGGKDIDNYWCSNT